MDNFCFVVRHEIEHVLREDGKKETFTLVDEIDGEHDDENLPPEEKIANKAAADF